MYNFDKRGINQITDETFNEFTSVENVYIPEILPEESAELNGVLEGKIRAIPQVHIDLGFVDPLRLSLGQKIPGAPVPHLLTTDIRLINADDITFSHFLRDACDFLCQSFITERGFNNALLENHTEFISDTVTDANIVREANMLGQVVETIVFRYMNIMINNA